MTPVITSFNTLMNGPLMKAWHADPNRIEASPSLLAPEQFELGDRGRFAEVGTKHRDVDVLREAVNEAKRLREGRAALEQESGQPRAESVEEEIERPADPEVFLDVLDRGAQTTSRREEEFPAFVVGCGDHMAIGDVLHG
jgi:hypothetical protein